MLSYFQIRNALQLLLQATKISYTLLSDMSDAKQLYQTQNNSNFAL